MKEIFAQTGFALLLVLAASASVAAEPGIIPLQGLLTDAQDNPIDGPHRVTINLYAEATGGTALYTDEYSTVDFDAGYLAIYLGSQADDLDLDLFRDQPSVFVEVILDGSEVLSPRLKLGSVPYAGYAQYCGHADTADTADTATNATSAANASMLEGRAAASFQTRVAQTCGAGSSIRAIDDAGMVTCEVDSVLDEAAVDGHVANNGYPSAVEIVQCANTNECLCPGGKKVLGGGVSCNHKSQAVYQSQPNGPAGTGWYGTCYTNASATPENVWAICANY